MSHEVSFGNTEADQLSLLTVTFSDLLVSFVSFQQILLKLTGMKLWLVYKKSSFMFPQTEWSFLKHSPNAYTETLTRYICFICKRWRVSWKIRVTSEHLCREVCWECVFVCESKRHASVFAGLCLKSWGHSVCLKIPEGFQDFTQEAFNAVLMLLKEALGFVSVFCSGAKVRVSETL